MHVRKNTQSGFAHLSFIVALVVVASVGFVGGSVYSTQKKKQEAARIAAEEKNKAAAVPIEKKETNDTEQKTVEIPAAEAEKKIVEPASSASPKPTTTTAPKTTAQASYTKFDIPSASSQVNPDHVVVTAALGKTLSGVCAVSVYGVSQTATFLGGKTSLWYETNFSSQDNCSVAIPREKLSGSGTYKYQMYYVDNYSNKTMKGTSAYYNFDL